jgi:hypothetical protein
MGLVLFQAPYIHSLSSFSQQFHSLLRRTQKLRGNRIGDLSRVTIGTSLDSTQSVRLWELTLLALVIY